MTPFEFHVVMPPDPTLASMIRDVVAHGARHAGSDEGAALSFGCTVEDAVRDMIDGPAGDERVDIVVRRDNGPIQVVVTAGRTTRTFSMDI